MRGDFDMYTDYVVSKLFTPEFVVHELQRQGYTRAQIMSAIKRKEKEREEERNEGLQRSAREVSS